ncbi:hypothetical protein [Azospirillum isscasi]|uniref:Uncharacterized protein n=1 Tax=Azospirillum isscasi TaxID=3053926 RepID=A0ABU0WT50_9PROT|nr:hypothetical protein [Azospirillum isscasi]MDQ2106714.1 hypothetical protein [Azospirillum isscasi]
MTIVGPSGRCAAMAAFRCSGIRSAHSDRAGSAASSGCSAGARLAASSQSSARQSSTSLRMRCAARRTRVGLSMFFSRHFAGGSGQVVHRDMDDGQRVAEFVRHHGEEVALLRHGVALDLQGRLGLLAGGGQASLQLLVGGDVVEVDDQRIAPREPHRGDGNAQPEPPSVGLPRRPAVRRPSAPSRRSR